MPTRRRRDLRAPRPVLARPGRPRHRLDEAAAGAAAGARHQPVRLPPAAGRASASWATTRSSADKLGLSAQSRFGEQDLGFLGERSEGGGFAGPQALATHVEQVLGRPVTLVAGSPDAITRVALVHRRRARLFRGRHRRRRAGLHHRRDLRAAGALRARVRREPTSPAATTPPSATARRRWQRTWRRSSGWSTASSTSTTPHDASIRPHPRRSRGHRARRSSPRHSARRPSCWAAASSPATWRCMRRAAAWVRGQRAAAAGGADRVRPRSARRRRRAASPCCRSPTPAQPPPRAGERRRRRAWPRRRVVWAARAALRGEIAAAGDRAAAQGGAVRGRPAVPRPHRAAAGRGGGARRLRRRADAGAHDAGQRRAAHGAGQHPHVACARRSMP